MREPNVYVIAFWAFLISIGMIRAFFAGKRSGKEGHSTSYGLWYGYGQGLFVSISTFLVIIFLTWVVYFVIDPSDVLESLGFLVLMFVLCSVFIMFVGLIVFTASSFFGYGIGKQIYVSSIMEKEASKTLEEIENDMSKR